MLPSKFPDVVIEDPGLRVWHKLDDTFFTPRVVVLSRIVMLEMKHDVKARVSIGVLTNLVNLALAEETYQGAPWLPISYSYGSPNTKVPPWLPI